MSAVQRVVVTGAAGLLGRHVLDACRARGWETTGLDLVENEEAGILRCDLLDGDDARERLAGADAVVHTAALPRPIGFAPEAVFETNTRTLFNVLAALESLEIRRLVHASSFSVLGLPFAPSSVRLDYFPIDEDHPARPQDVYALSKWLGEEMIEAWHRRTGGAATSLRMPWIQTPATFPREVVPRRETAEAARDLWAYLDARDAAAAFVAALESEPTGHERLYLSAPDTYSERPTAELVREGWPDVPRRSPLAGHASLISCDRAERLLGFRPRYRWRNYDSV